jgi:hypothetical protein
MGMTKTIDVVFTLRRDNDYNYEKVKNTFIPAKGEPCLVDTSKDGLRVIVGDGKTLWKDLDFADNFLIKGYYNSENGCFYEDYDSSNSDDNESGFTNEIEGSVNKLYIDLLTNAIFFYERINGNGQFISYTGSYNYASDKIAGVMKLYDETGNNTDGTMTQRATTTELNKKLEAQIDLDKEMLELIFKSENIKI